MRQDETIESRALVTTSISPRPSFQRSDPGVAFLSQLIAERHHLSTQRARRRASVPVALAIYASSTRLAERRLPAGYVTRLLV